MIIKKTLFALSLACCIVGIGQAEPAGHCGHPPKGKANSSWCHCFHKTIYAGCMLRDGDDVICTDIHLLKLLHAKITRFMQLYQKHHELAQQKSEFFELIHYFRHCPINTRISAALKKKHNFSIQNLNQTLKIKFKKHVLLIGFDGVRIDAFIKASHHLETSGQAKYFSAFMRHATFNKKLYAGGNKKDKTLQPTLSESGWTSILTGVYANQHHLVNNGDIVLGKYNHKIATIYNLLRIRYPNAIVSSYSDWKPISTVANYRYNNGNNNANINFYYKPSGFYALFPTLNQMTYDIVHAIKSMIKPLFIYAHYDDSDESGHIYGFSSDDEKYVMAIEQQALYANRLLKAVSQIKGQEWLVILTTDHGGHQYNHGSQKSVDRDIFAVVGKYHNGKITPVSQQNKPQGMIVIFQWVKNFLL